MTNILLVWFELSSSSLLEENCVCRIVFCGMFDTNISRTFCLVEKPIKRAEKATPSKLLDKDRQTGSMALGQSLSLHSKATSPAQAMCIPRGFSNVHAPLLSLSPILIRSLLLSPMPAPRLSTTFLPLHTLLVRDASPQEIRPCGITLHVSLHISLIPHLISISAEIVCSPPLPGVPSAVIDDLLLRVS